MEEYVKNEGEWNRGNMRGMSGGWMRPYKRIVGGRMKDIREDIRPYKRDEWRECGYECKYVSMWGI